MTLADRIDAYLDGLLSRAEARALEAELIEPEVAAALAEALAFRDLLMTAPPAAPPEGLTDRIEAALGLDRPPHAPPAVERPPRLGALRSVLAGLSWAVRGPALVAARPGLEEARLGLASATGGLLVRGG